MTYKECYGESSSGELDPPSMKPPTTRDQIVKVGEGLTSLLLYKNSKYGDTALNPLNVMSKSPALEKLLIRADDKISRIKNSEVLRKNDICDLLGYLTLICVHQGWDDFNDQKD